MGQKSEWRGKSGTILGDFMQYKPWHYGKLSLRGEGGSRSKNFFLVILVANLVYFHPLFTEFENLDPKVLNFADLSGWVGPQVLNFGHLEKIDVQRVKKL